MTISGDNGDFIVIGSNSANHKFPHAAFLAKANASDLNKWICFSVHWDMRSSQNTNESCVYCNGEKFATFTGKTVSGDTKLSLGDIKNNTNSPLDGSIAFFSVLKYEKMTEKEILFNHYVLCNLYSIDHNPINI